MATSHGRAAAALLCIAGALGPIACGGKPAPRGTAHLSVTDDAGDTLALASPARRIVALIPSVNETLLALGAGDRLIARTQFDRDPRLRRLPSVGGGLTPDIEWLAARRPDLVIAWPDQRSRAVVTRLRALGIPVYAARLETLGDADRTTRALGLLLGLERKADLLVTAIHAQLDSVARRATALSAPRVLYLIGLEPPEAAGRGTFVDELLEVAGGRNAFDDLPLWPNISVEEALRRDPDVLVLALYEAGGPGAVGRLAATPGWSAFRAVREGRVAWLDPDLANRPGPRAGEAARALFEAIHGLRGRGETGTRGRGETASGRRADAAGLLRAGERRNGRLP